MKVADRLSVLAGGAASMVVSGGVVSAGGGGSEGRVERALPTHIRHTSGAHQWELWLRNQRLQKRSLLTSRRSLAAFARGRFNAERRVDTATPDPSLVDTAAREPSLVDTAAREPSLVDTAAREPSLVKASGFGVRREKPELDAWADTPIRAIPRTRTVIIPANRLRRPRIAAVEGWRSVCERARSFILSPTLTGLADGLALKELRYAASCPRFAPN